MGPADEPDEVIDGPAPPDVRVDPATGELPPEWAWAEEDDDRELDGD